MVSASGLNLKDGFLRCVFFESWIHCFVLAPDGNIVVLWLVLQILNRVQDVAKDEFVKLCNLVRCLILTL